MAARAIYYASHHPRREYYVGHSTVQAIVGNKLVPSLLDHYLARTGYAAQQHDGREDPDRPNNLWEPVPGDHGAHGSFDRRARDYSVEWWLDSHRLLLGLTGLAGAAAALYATFKNGRLEQIYEVLEDWLPRTA